MTQADALAELKDLTASDDYPTLAQSFLEDLLDRYELYRVWEAEQDIEVGERFAPTVKNGRFYICVQEGQTGETEPAWPTKAGAFFGQQIADNEVIWEDAGKLPRKQWDLDRAAYDGWMRKAGATAGKFNIQDSGQNQQRAQIHAHCLTMAASFGRQGVIG
jgi:hypothetical protein